MDAKISSQNRRAMRRSLRNAMYVEVMVMGEHWFLRWAAKIAWHTDFDNKANHEAVTCRKPLCLAAVRMDRYISILLK